MIACNQHCTINSVRSVNLPLIYRGLGFLKNHRKGGGIRLTCKNEGEGGKHCFSLIMYRFCSSNTLYSASLPFRMFIFILTHVDT